MLKYLFTLMLFASQAHAFKPSDRSCEFYRELENRTNCGPNGYPLSFGYRMCELYRKEESDESKAIKRWFPKIRYCLQRYLYDNAHRARNCDDLKRMAIQSHVPCYVETGYCELGPVSLARILYLTGKDAISVDVANVGAKVTARCMAQAGNQSLENMRRERRGSDY